MRPITPWRASRRRRGVPLWSHLTALVLVPLIGVVVLTAVSAQARVGEAASAGRAEAAVRALAELDAARTGVDHEIIPVLSLVVISDPSVASALGLPPAVLAAQADQARAGQRQVRQDTDAALAKLAGAWLGSAAGRNAAEALRSVRSSADKRQLQVSDIYLRYLDVSNELMNAEREVASAAIAEGVPGETLRATQDVLTTAQFAQSASHQMPIFMASIVARRETLVGSRLASQTAWLAYTDAQRQMANLSQESVRTAWSRARSSDVMTQLDKVLAPPADGSATPKLGIPQLISLLFQGAQRDQMLTNLVNTAVTGSQKLAAADHQRAQQRLITTLELSAALLLASLVGAVALGRTLARSLGRLAGQATRISEGQLVEVRATGPREVRTVSAALGSAVDGLRRIQDQAHAVARGDLDNALLTEPLPGPLGEVVHASVKAIVNSVRQREELQFALAHQATHDPLTELPNRAQALTLVTSALHRGRRSGGMTGLLFVDLDGFKAVNDSHGHSAGDEVLREVALRLRTAVRPGDVVCRLGGDEFVVLVEPVLRERDLQELADRLIGTLSDPIPVAKGTIRIGASIGIAISRDGGVDADVLFAEADTAAYRAKQHGRGRAEIFDDSLRRQLAARAELEAAIAEGLANGEMQLHYQPVIDVGTDRLTGYEALIRWERPGEGMVRPDEFIPVAEGSSLIYELDRWVLHEATRQLAEWRVTQPVAPGVPEPTVAVNISGRHLADRRVVSDVTDALEAAGLPAGLLVLEVTETVLVDDPAAIGHLADLRALGVGIAIDDFGTGYTSIGQLRHMPVDTLKIDRSFVASTDPGHRELVALIISAAHTFGLTVVAEGVEEPEQLARLKAQACDLAQGYLLSRPLPAAAAADLLRALAVPPAEA